MTSDSRRPKFPKPGRSRKTAQVIRAGRAKEAAKIKEAKNPPKPAPEPEAPEPPPSPIDKYDDDHPYWNNGAYYPSDPAEVKARLQAAADGPIIGGSRINRFRGYALGKDPSKAN